MASPAEKPTQPRRLPESRFSSGGRGVMPLQYPVRGGNARGKMCLRYMQQMIYNVSVLHNEW